MNPHDVLGIKPGATEEEIKSAYRKAALESHPDRNPGDEAAAQKFKDITTAYDTLTGKSPQQQARNPFGDFNNVNDIFSNFFHFNFGGNPFQQKQTRGNDIQIEHTISFVDAAKGCIIDIKIPRPELCKECNGQGAKSPDIVICEVCAGKGTASYRQGPLTVHTTCQTCQGKGKTIIKPCKTCNGGGKVPNEVPLKISVPPGIADNMRVRLDHQGEPCEGGTPGDAYVVIRVRTHRIFSRAGDDIMLTLPITYSQAVLGDKIKIPLIDEEVELIIPANVESNAVLRISGKGFNKIKTPGKGDCVINIQIDTKPTEDMLTIIKKMQEVENKKPSVKIDAFWKRLNDSN